MNDPALMRIALWGLGGHAFKTVLPALAAGHRLAGVYSRNPESRRRAEREYGCVSWPSEVAMLSDSTVDAVYLATPVATHFEQGMQVLAAGRSLLGEKSLTDRRDNSLALVATAKQRNLLLCETLIYQFHPRVRSLTEMVRAGEFGRIVSMTCAFHLPGHAAAGYRNDPTLGGGALFDVACYPLSLVVMLGFSEPMVVDGQLFYPADSRVDSGGVARIAFDGSSQALVSWGYGAAYRNEATLIGEKGSVTIDCVFTKGGAPCTELQLRDARGSGTTRRYADTDGTQEMLAYASRARSIHAMKDELWQRAGRQAELMEQLRQFASI